MSETTVGFAMALLGPLLIIGCDAGVVTPDSSPAGDALAASHASAGKTAFRGTGLGVLAGQDFPPGPGRSDFDGRCSVPSDLVLRFTLSGEATHLGRYEAELEHCIQVDFTTGLGTMTDGMAVFTASDGDELWDEYDRLVPGSSSVDPEEHRFVGGTGRFAGATGVAAVIARCDRSAGTCDVQLEGVLKHDASSHGS